MSILLLDFRGLCGMLWSVINSLKNREKHTKRWSAVWFNLSTRLLITPRRLTFIFGGALL